MSSLSALDVVEIVVILDGVVVVVVVLDVVVPRFRLTLLLSSLSSLCVV
jgi:hypothetical protein